MKQKILQRLEFLKNVAIANIFSEYIYIKSIDSKEFEVKKKNRTKMLKMLM